MASNEEAYSQFGRRSNQPENEDYGETQATSNNDGISINRLMVANLPRRPISRRRGRHRVFVVRRREAIHQRRDAYIQQFRHANHMINSEVHSSGMEFQSRFDSVYPEVSMTTIEYAEILESLAEDDDVELKTTPTAKSFIDSLKVKKVECEKDIPFCVVCQDMMNVGDFLMELPCMHNYHVDCIQSWLATRNTCPVCRFELPTSDLVLGSVEE
ncbi:probable E3 ubiquitin-protein ligase RHG1A [Daucus carota subsp. sativus]|uniref:probable E3 ubiquitin-protein ligase RHG1A n=1 Tax=Daucus carota subsp. sativus TaxID=79200 RepID=UPI0007B1F1D0|nr:PREDICTED: probable E3 ubiquitin-protein ligase RHG1A [Daucus carota subsp. sativus]